MRVTITERGTSISLGAEFDHNVTATEVVSMFVAAMKAHTYSPSVISRALIDAAEKVEQ